MTRSEVTQRLSANATELRALGVAQLSLFGSVARGEERADSDVDLLVDFARPLGLLAIAGIQRRLTDMLGTKVDLVRRRVVIAELREHIDREAIPCL